MDPSQNSEQGFCRISSTNWDNLRLLVEALVCLLCTKDYVLLVSELAFVDCAFGVCCREQQQTRGIWNYALRRASLTLYSLRSTLYSLQSTLWLSLGLTTANDCGSYKPSYY